jgi:Co/Zn/Cd efflux system component
MVRGRRWALIAALHLNLTLFFVEAGVGIGARSNALLADSLDMLADALSYAASLFVIGRGPRWSGAAALLKGSTMLWLGLAVLARTGMGLRSGGVPEVPAMAGTAFLAMLGNAICVWLLSGHREGSTDLRAAWLCSRNDLFGNALVLLAAAFTAWRVSPFPDALAGLAIASLLIGTALGILRAALGEMRLPRIGTGVWSGAPPGPSVLATD